MWAVGDRGSDDSVNAGRPRQPFTSSAPISTCARPAPDTRFALAPRWRSGSPPTGSSGCSEHGFWIPLTILFVLRPEREETFHRLDPAGASAPRSACSSRPRSPRLVGRRRRRDCARSDASRRPSPTGYSPSSTPSSPRRSPPTRCSWPITSARAPSAPPVSERRAPRWG